MLQLAENQFNDILIDVGKIFCIFAGIFNRQIMKRIANELVKADGAYVAPCCFVMNLYSEGILCQSGTTGGGYHQGVGGDDSSLI